MDLSKWAISFLFEYHDLEWLFPSRCTMLIAYASCLYSICVIIHTDYLWWQRPPSYYIILLHLWGIARQVMVMPNCCQENDVLIIMSHPYYTTIVATQEKMKSQLTPCHIQSQNESYQSLYELKDMVLAVCIDMASAIRIQIEMLLDAFCAVDI